MGGVHLAQGTRLIALDHAVLLPAAHADHLVANGVLRASRLDHFADRTAAHGLAQRLRCGIALGVIHAATHVRVQAEVVVAHQHLAVLQGRCLCHYALEIAGLGFADRAVVEVDLDVLGHCRHPASRRARC